MSDVVFSPEKWQSGGDALSRAAEKWKAQTAPIIPAIEKPIEGADQGATLVDMAVTVLCGPVGAVVTEMIDGIVESLQATAHNMGETGKEYAAVEEQNTGLARQILGPERG